MLTFVLGAVVGALATWVVTGHTLKQLRMDVQLQVADAEAKVKAAEAKVNEVTEKL